MATDLYIKYKVERFDNYSGLNPLSYILRKSELGKNLTAAEWDWLGKNELTETIAIIKDQEKYRESVLSEIKNELILLKNNDFFSSPIKEVPSLDSEIPLILYKMNVLEKLTGSDYSFVAHCYYNYNRYVDFIDKKRKLGITDKIPFEEISDRILSKIANNINILASDIEFIVKHKAVSFSTVIKCQFENLKIKYKVLPPDETHSADLLLFHILQKISEFFILDKHENKYLLDNGFNEAYDISQQVIFSSLKTKYSVGQDIDNNIDGHLYKVLKKLEAKIPLPESDVNYLKKRNLSDAIKIAFKNTADGFNNKIDAGSSLCQDDIEWCERYYYKEIVFKWLVKKFNIEYFAKSLDSYLYDILKKMCLDKRLDDIENLWLIENNLFGRKSKIYIKYHILEAKYSEHEFENTNDHWKLVNASALWRKAENSKRAVSLTENLDIKTIKPGKLKSALLTTRGGALRDMGRLDEAEECARSAIEYHREKHNPYTLMGALCFDTGRYAEGSGWFEEAVVKGAKPQDQDSEIRRILQKNHDPKLIDHLLKRDSSRFAWVKSYANKLVHKNNKG